MGKETPFFIFLILDTMMASHISEQSVSAVAYLSQVRLILSSVAVMAAAVSFAVIRKFKRRYLPAQLSAGSAM